MRRHGARGLTHRTAHLGDGAPDREDPGWRLDGQVGPSVS